MSSINLIPGDGIQFLGLEEREALKSMLGNKSIVVLSHQMSFWVQGLGDFICGLKTSLYFQNYLNVNKANLTFFNNANDYFRSILENTEVSVEKEDFFQIRLRRPDLQVIIPVVDLLVSRPYVALNDVPTLAISEYGIKPDKDLGYYKSVHAYSLGLSKKSLGIFIDPELREWSKSENAKDRSFCLKELEYVPSELSTAILGKEYSQSAIDEFKENSKFYFCYASEQSEILSFIQAVMISDKSINVDNYTFYCMGDALDPKTLSIENFKRCSNLKEIISFNYLKNDHIVNLQINPAEKKTVRIITGKIAHGYVSRLHKASEKITLVTGNQSFSEAISAGKIVVFELLKHTARFYWQYLKIFPENLKEIAQLYNLRISSFNVSDFYLCMDVKFNVNSVVRFINASKNQTILDELQKVNDRIAEEFDFGPRFERVVYDLLNGVSVETWQDIQRISLGAVNEIEESDIPLNQPIYLQTSDLIKLAIRNDNWRSEHPKFLNSQFNILSSIGASGKIIVRKTIAE